MIGFPVIDAKQVSTHGGEDCHRFVNQPGTVREIDRAPVVGIDQTEILELGTLIDVGHSR